MEVQIIQARPQIVFVGNPGRCEDCEDEERKEALQEEIIEDRVNLSQESLKLAQSSGSENDLEAETEEEDSGSQAVGPKTEQQLTEEERRIVNELKARDAEVRAHEQAHVAAAGPYANGGPTYEYQTGPDGRQYAVGGEVSIDTSPVPGNPEATVRKAQTVKRAALAPREPSAQDRQVAAQAAQLEAQARKEVQTKKAEEREEAREKNSEENSISEESNSVEPESPFSRRVKNNFSPPTVSLGNLLNITS
ncbi:MAG: putative metalloprotease CJM1_0395 family protein [Nitrospinota bacterium]